MPATFSWPAVLAAALVAFLSAVAVVEASPAARLPEIPEKRLLSVEFDGVTAAVAFDELMRLGGVAIEVPRVLRRRLVTLQLREVTIEDAIRRTLRSLSVTAHAVVYSERNGPALRILALEYEGMASSRGGDSPRTPVSLPAIPSSPTPDRDPAAASLEKDLAAANPDFIPSRALLARLARR